MTQCLEELGARTEVRLFQPAGINKKQLNGQFMPATLSDKRERHSTFMGGWQMDQAVPLTLKDKGTNRQKGPKLQNSGAHRE